MVYPYYKDDPILTEYTELLNRLSGLADEMSGFFTRLKKLEIENTNNKVYETAQKHTDDIIANGTVDTKPKLETGIMQKTQKEKGKTIGECLATVLEE